MNRSKFKFNHILCGFRAHFRRTSNGSHNWEIWLKWFKEIHTADSRHEMQQILQFYCFIIGIVAPYPMRAKNEINNRPTQLDGVERVRSVVDRFHIHVPCCPDPAKRLKMDQFTRFAIAKSNKIANRVITTTCRAPWHCNQPFAHENETWPTCELWAHVQWAHCRRRTSAHTPTEYRRRKKKCRK